MQVVVRLNLGFNLALADVDGNDCMNGIPDGSIEQKLQRELYCGTKFGGKIHLRCAIATQLTFMKYLTILKLVLTTCITEALGSIGN